MDLKASKASKLSGLRIAEITDGKIKVLRHVYFKCQGCAKCCKDNKIPLSEEDIKIIEEGGYETDQILEEMSPVFIPKGKNKLIKAYIMRKKPFVNECVFLTEDNRCRIHQFKPLSCKIYPFAIEETENKTYIVVHNYNVCEYIHVDVPEKESNSIKIVEEILKHIKEREIYILELKKQE